MAHWLSGAIRRPGALTRKANAAGETPMEFAEQHKHDGGITGDEARLALTMRGFHHADAKKKPTRYGGNPFRD